MTFMPTAAKHFFRAALILLLAPHAAAAHDSLESDLSVWVRATGIDVQIYMSRVSAAMSLEKDGEHLLIMRDNFPAFEKRLAANGPALLSVTTGAGTTLKADASTASITDEDDICFRLHYPLPGVLPGPLVIHGNYLSKMEEGHVGKIYVLNTGGDQLGQGDFSAESPDFEAHLPAIAGAPPPPRPAADTAPASSTAPSAQDSHWGLWAMLIGSALIIASVAVRELARQKAERHTNP